MDCVCTCSLPFRYPRGFRLHQRNHPKKKRKKRREREKKFRTRQNLWLYIHLQNHWQRGRLCNFRNRNDGTGPMISLSHKSNRLEVFANLLVEVGHQQHRNILLLVEYPWTPCCCETKREIHKKKFASFPGFN